MTHGIAVSAVHTKRRIMTLGIKYGTAISAPPAIRGIIRLAFLPYMNIPMPIVPNSRESIREVESMASPPSIIIGALQAGLNAPSIGHIDHVPLAAHSRRYFGPDRGAIRFASFIRVDGAERMDLLQEHSSDAGDTWSDEHVSADCRAGDSARHRGEGSEESRNRPGRSVRKVEATPMPRRSSALG